MPGSMSAILLTVTWLILAAILLFIFAVIFKWLVTHDYVPQKPQLYLRAVMPHDAPLYDYSPWYIGHALESMTSDDALQLLRRQYEDTHDCPECDGLYTFMDWLEQQHGYTVFHSGGDGDNGVAVIHCVYDQEGLDDDSADD